jgi:hypothetical protein
MFGTRQHVKGTLIFKTMRSTPSRVQKYLYVVSLQESSCPLHFGATRVNVRWLVCHWWTFIFFPSFLFIPPKITGWYSLLLVFQILFLFFWFLIFVLGLFVKNLFISISSFYPKYGILFLPIWSLLFWFLLSFC